MSRWLYTGFIALLALERLYELHLSKRNAKRAFANGAIELGLRHYPAMVAFHGAFLISCVGEPWLLDRQPDELEGLLALIVALLSQSLRYWALSSLGDRWNNRIIVLPGVAPITEGPYRFIRHPHYLSVLIEMVSVPLIHNAWLTALIFPLGYAALLSVRIPAEERALGDAWTQAFARLRRFVPGGRSP